jgi:eukaryotic-like serine/threonine-protein kinase
MGRPIKLLDATKGRPRLDRYELIAELAAGGMATVYLARIGGAGGFQRFVAIKRLHPHLAHEPEFMEMFLDEARLAAGIHHPNVVPILEVGEVDAGEQYLVMEYIEGDTLGNLRAAARKKGERLGMPVMSRLLLDALQGLHAAHELRDEGGQLLNVVHRDVSPQNILVGIDGSARITDFGVARATTRLASTRSGDVKGKVAYMAPEQVRADPEIDRRADVFAMGIVIWEVFADRHLFRGGNEIATITRVLNEPIPNLHEVDPQIPAALAGVIATALQRDRDLRWPTCEAFARALEQSLRGTATPATQREVVLDAEKYLGEDIHNRRDLVRAWLASSVDTWNDTSGASSSISRKAQLAAHGQHGQHGQLSGNGTGSGPLPHVATVASDPGTTAGAAVTSRHDTGSHRSLLAAVAGIAGTVVVGGIAFLALRPAEPPATAPAAATTTTAPSATAAVASADSPPEAAPSASVAVSAAPSAEPAPPEPPVKTTKVDTKRAVGAKAAAPATTAADKPPSGKGPNVEADSTLNPFR